MTSSEPCVVDDFTLTTCGVCGAVLWVGAPDAERPTESERLHLEWHKELGARIKRAGKPTVYR